VRERALDGAADRDRLALLCIRTAGAEQHEERAACQGHSDHGPKVWFFPVAGQQSCRAEWHVLWSPATDGEAE
jgi:hypothetical protein